MKISLQLSENMHFIATSRHFKDIHVDEPETFQGTDLGPSSVEYILIGIGGCLGSTLTFCLRKNNVEINDLKIYIEGKLSHVGPKNHLRLIEVNAELVLSTNNTDFPEKVESCINTFKEHCVVSNSIIQGLPINVEVMQKN